MYASGLMRCTIAALKAVSATVALLVLCVSPATVASLLLCVWQEEEYDGSIEPHDQVANQVPLAMPYHGLATLHGMGYKESTCTP